MERYIASIVRVCTNSSKRTMIWRMSSDYLTLHPPRLYALPFFRSDRTPGPRRAPYPARTPAPVSGQNSASVLDKIVSATRLERLPSSAGISLLGKRLYALPFFRSLLGHVQSPQSREKWHAWDSTVGPLFII